LLSWASWSGSISRKNQMEINPKLVKGLSGAELNVSAIKPMD
jgi:hypothetical protein